MFSGKIHGCKATSIRWILVCFFYFFGGVLLKDEQNFLDWWDDYVLRLVDRKDLSWLLAQHEESLWLYELWVIRLLGYKPGGTNIPAKSIPANEPFILYLRRPWKAVQLWTLHHCWCRKLWMLLWRQDGKAIYSYGNYDPCAWPTDDTRIRPKMQGEMAMTDWCKVFLKEIFHGWIRGLCNL